MIKNLGRPITRDKAEKEINKFLEIREETFQLLLDAVDKSSIAAREYYSQKENSFVFDLPQLNEFIGRFSSSGCNGLRVYYAASPTDERIDGNDRKEGSTTLVIVPCTIHRDPQTEEILSISNTDNSNADDGGIEYPGGISSPELGNRVVSIISDVARGKDILLSHKIKPS